MVDLFKKIIKQKLVKVRKDHQCIECNKIIRKKGMAYRDKHTIIFDDGDKITCDSIIMYTCIRCNYKITQKANRFNEFKKVCSHPEKFIDTIYDYIPGEAVKQPDHCECLLCGQTI